MRLPVELLAIAEQEYPQGATEITAIRSRNKDTQAITLDGRAHFELRRSMIVNSARENVDIAFERYIGTHDLLPINYLLMGYLQSKSVGRIRYFDKNLQKTAYATGFMISPELMMTNHHVFPVTNLSEFAALIEGAQIEFGYEYDLLGKLGDTVVHALDPETFFHTNKALDFALVAVRSFDATSRRQLSNQGYLILNGKLGKAGTSDYATIIQHPDGKEKQIALRNNEIINNSFAETLIYKSDTAPGSSGAPVFNNEWQLIALHSAGVAKKDSNGNYLDKDDQIIEIEKNQIEESRVVWISNRGIRISAIVNYLFSSSSAVALHPLIQILNIPTYSDRRPFTTANLSSIFDQEAGRKAALPLVSTQPAVAIPVSIVPIEIRISIGDGKPIIETLLSEVPKSSVLSTLDAEKKIEDEQDFSTCMGYVDDFMEIHIPMPRPSPELRKKLSFLKNSPNSYTLKYQNYSTFQHAVRRVPILSAINVHGKYRYEALGKDTRKDNWLRDNRIDYEAQLDDGWYLKSGFDKGHLSRREDAEWGSTMSKAKISADMTCVYTNAVPQVPAFNRAIMGHHGQWGILEQKLLEQGIKGEVGKSAKICVFSGPLFLDDDPVYASVQVALSCFKVVIWFDKTGKLRATGFRLSQEEQVGGIDFEALNFDKLLKLQQKSLAWIEDATGLMFADILKSVDTFDGQTESMNVAALERLVKRQSRRVSSEK
jgi:endonuclease G, mitochondrial